MHATDVLAHKTQNGLNGPKLYVYTGNGNGGLFFPFLSLWHSMEKHVGRATLSNLIVISWLWTLWIVNKSSVWEPIRILDCF